MPAAEIIAAIVSAAAAAATSAAEALREGLKQSGTRAGLIINAGPNELEEIAAQIIWGNWSSPPSNQAVGEPSPEVLFAAWKESGQVPAAIKDAIDKMKSYQEMSPSQSFLFISWAEVTLKQSAGQPATFSAIGSGGGVEALAVYQVKDKETDPKNQTVAAFYIIGGGSWYSTYGGCALISRQQFDEFHNADSTLRNLMTKIYESLDNPSPGFDCSSGETRRVALGKWTCLMNGGFLSEFSLSYDYSGATQSSEHRWATRVPRENQPPHPKHRQLESEMTFEQSLAFTERDGLDIAIETAPMELSVGMNPPVSPGRLFPQYNGFRIKRPGDPRIWLVDRGLKRHIPNPTTFNNLFRNWSYREVLDIDAIQTGPPISDGAFLGRAIGEAAVFLFDQQEKRHIVNEATMDKYNFNWNRICSLPKLVVEMTATGDPIR